MRAILPLLLAAACADTSGPAETKEWTFPAAGLARVRVFCERGTVRAATAEGPEVRVAVAAHGDAALAKLVAVEGDALIVSRHDGARLEWTVTAPPGLALEVNGKKLDIAVEGDWTEAKLRTEAGIAVAKARIGGGDLHALAGSIDVDLEGAPTRDFRCESLRGDVAVAVPATFHGSLHFASGARRIRLERHPALWIQPSVRGEAANGFVGKRPTQGEYRKMHDEGRPPPGIWALAPDGEVDFRLK